jgi:hypothetical protein
MSTKVLTARPPATTLAARITPGLEYTPEVALAMLQRQATAARATIAEHATCETVRALNHEAGIRRATGPMAVVTSDDDIIAGLAWLAEGE